MTIAYVLMAVLLSSADLSFEWTAAIADSTSRTRGIGLSVGYLGVWEVVSESAGLRARLHAPDFGFAGATLIARDLENRVFLVAAWTVVAIAWFLHIASVASRKSRALH